MTTFTAKIESQAVVHAERSAIWAALIDPDLLPKLTPLLRSIDADGDVWIWHMTRIAALGVSISPDFTEKMTFTPQTRISFTHQPPAGAREWASTEGFYELTDVPEADGGGTHLAIELSLCVELPLPRAAKPAVTGVMKATMQRTGDKFSQNLLEHLGVRA